MKSLEKLTNIIESILFVSGTQVAIADIAEKLEISNQDVLKVAEKLKEKGCPKVVVCDLAREDMAEAVEDAFRYGKLVLATTTYNADIFPFMKSFIDHLTERNYQNRKMALIENGSWAPAAARIMKEKFSKSKNISWIETVVSIRSAMNDKNMTEIENLANELCD